MMRTQKTMQAIYDFAKQLSEHKGKEMNVYVLYDKDAGNMKIHYDEKSPFTLPYEMTVKRRVMIIRTYRAGKIMD